MSNYEQHAKNEFFHAGWTDENGVFNDEMQELMCKQVLELIVKFSEHGHSGSTAPYAINLFKRLASFDIVSPLTGVDSEWAEPFSDDGTQQNKRQTDVFRDADGSSYWANGRIFRDESGCCITSSKSTTEVVFPWVKPEPEYIDITTDESGNTVYPEGI